MRTSSVSASPRLDVLISGAGIAGATLASLLARQGHRITVVECDQIFMMAHGQIIERGTHEQLVAKRGAYYEMARHQLQIEDEQPAPENASAT